MNSKIRNQTCLTEMSSIAPKKKVLYVCHNHPAIYPGGAEAYALELYESMRESDEFEPIFLARGRKIPHPGTPFSAVNDDANQYLMNTNAAEFDFFYMTSRNKELYTKHFREFLLAHQPDIVHFQHTLFLGYELIRQTRNTLPHVPMIYTLHEYQPICHRDGQMVRTINQELCHEASPHRCHECFPDIATQSFFMRKRFIQSHFSLVDLFIAPSRFLLERYVAWGIPREKIRFEDYGRRGVQSITETEEERPRNRIGFFGQLNPYKGLNVLLKAMKLLNESAATSTQFSRRWRNFSSPQGLTGDSYISAHLWIHGANLELQQHAFQEEFRSLLEATRQNVTLVGRYRHDELPKLMANIDWVVVPSVWWENAPLVIQEAFMYGRPVICSDVGGMAEKVTHEVNGLHFRVGDPVSLAQTICRAVSTPGLWERLRKEIPEVYRMERHVAQMTETYNALLNSRYPS